MVSLDVLTKEQLIAFPGVEHYPAEEYRNFQDIYKIGEKYGKYEPAFNGRGGAKYIVDAKSRDLKHISMAAGCVQYPDENAKTLMGNYHCPFVITTLPYGDNKHIASDLVPDSPDGTQKVLLSLQWRSSECSIKQCDRYVLGTFIIKEKFKRGKFDCILLLRHVITLADSLNYTTVLMADAVKNKREIVQLENKLKAITKSRDYNREKVSKLQTEFSAVKNLPLRKRFLTHQLPLRKRFLTCDDGDTRLPDHMHNQ